MAKRNPLRISDLAKMRAEAEATYQRAMARVDRIETPFKIAEKLAQAWIKGRKGREARVWAYDTSVSLYFGLAANEIFASAEDAFDRAQVQMRASLPAYWSGEWSEVKDGSSDHEACRGSTLDCGPCGEGYRSWDAGVRIYLHVYASVAKGSACTVVKIGEKQEPDYGYTAPRPMRTVPVYRAVCPGDPVPAQALRLAASINPKLEA